MIVSLTYRMELALVALAVVATLIGLKRRNSGVLLLAASAGAAAAILVVFGMMSHAENRYGFVAFGNIALLAALAAGMVTSKVWETNRLAELVSDVLDTSRIEAGTFSFRFRDVDLAQLVREVVATARLGQDEVYLHADLHDLLPEVRGDAERLRQVLTNLIDNAIKYSPAGSEVEVRAYPEDGRIRIDVRDRGPGIAKADQKLIFEKFGRVTGPGATRPGTGLGLFIARSIAEAHGGALEVHSAPEQGSTFTLELPAQN
jgi:signal transduction histidine kinase